VCGLILYGKVRSKVRTATTARYRGTKGVAARDLGCIQNSCGGGGGVGRKKAKGVGGCLVWWLGI